MATHSPKKVMDFSDSDNNLWEPELGLASENPDERPTSYVIEVQNCRDVHVTKICANCRCLKPTADDANKAEGNHQRIPADTSTLEWLLPDVMPWAHLAAMLGRKFELACGSSLKEKDLNYLLEKLLDPSDVNRQHRLIRKSRIFVDTLPQTNFTFWQWFSSVVELTERHLKEPYAAGAIEGFISKHEVIEKLCQSPIGTVMLRFSDSVLGGVSFAYVMGRNGNQQRRVEFVQPFSMSKELTMKTLAEILHDCASWLKIVQLKIVYPNIPISHAFPPPKDPWQAKRVHPSNGYVKHRLLTVIQAS